MLITFIDPPNLLAKSNIERVFGCTYSLYPFPNIFSLYNAAVLEEEGYQVRYLDMANQGWGRRRLVNFFKQDLSDVYVFHSVNLSIKSDLRVHQEIRAVNKQAFIIFCGPAPTFFSEVFLKDERTFCLRGETEVSILELIRCLDRKEDPSTVKGVSYQNRSGVIHNPWQPLVDNLDRLPYPARHLTKRYIYYNPKLSKGPFTAMETSRNCCYRCLFCVPNSASFACELEYRKNNSNRKPPTRLRSAENVVSEFKLLKSQGYKSISIIDDQFLWDKERTIKICRAIKDLNMHWGCLARADHLSAEITKHLAEAGCRYVDIGVESFNQDTLNYIRKDTKVEMIYRAVHLLKRYGILAKINIILGCSPHQSKDDINSDLKKAKELDVDAVMFSIATPFPGTEFYRLAKENRWFVKGDYYPQSVQMKAIISYPKLSNRELEQLIRRANLSFYFSPRFIKKNLLGMLSLRRFYTALKALKRKFF